MALSVNLQYLCIHNLESKVPEKEPKPANKTNSVVLVVNSVPCMLIIIGLYANNLHAKLIVLYVAYYTISGKSTVLWLVYCQDNSIIFPFQGQAKDLYILCNTWFCVRASS